MSDQPLCGHCMLPVAKGLPGIKHMGTSVAHPHVSMCLEATREAARAWQAFRDFLNGTPKEWARHALDQYLRGVREGLNGGQA